MKQLGDSERSYILGRAVWSIRKNSSGNILYKDKKSKEGNTKYHYVPKSVLSTKYLDIKSFQRGLLEGTYLKWKYSNGIFPFPNLRHRNILHTEIPEYLTDIIDKLFSLDNVDLYPGLLTYNNVFMIGIDEEILNDYKDIISEVFNTHNTKDDFISFKLSKTASL